MRLNGVSEDPHGCNVVAVLGKNLLVGSMAKRSELLDIVRFTNLHSVVGERVQIDGSFGNVVTPDGPHLIQDQRNCPLSSFFLWDHLNLW